MHCSCSALAATWISGLCCLLESLWSLVWINASTWQGSILVQGAPATSSHCTLREARKQPRPPRCPKSLGSPSSHPLCRWWMGSFPGTASKNNSPCPSAPRMLMFSSFHQLYGILIPCPLPRGRYVPYPSPSLLCMLAGSRLFWALLQTNFLLLATKQMTFSLEETFFLWVSYSITSQLK